MEDSDRVHYAITNTGGKSPNVVQAEAEVRYLIRSATNPKCKKLYERVVRIAQGAALMTDTKLEVLFDEGLSNTVPNFALEDVIAKAFQTVEFQLIQQRSVHMQSSLRTAFRLRIS